MKKKLAFFLSVCLLVCCVAACAPQQEQPEDTGSPTATPTAAVEEDGAEAGAYTPGEYTGSAIGFGGEVTVTVSVDETSILSVVAEGAQETDGVGSNAIDRLPGMIVEAQSAAVDDVAGATMTSTAIRTAAEAALAEARGEAAVEAVMAPGSYTGYGSGYSLVEKLPVTVTVDETSILSIEVAADNAETEPILRTVIQNMIPDMIEHQSVAVDSTTGATISAAAVREAVSDALVQALEAGGSDASALSYFQTIPEDPAPSSETLDVDILIVGMGGAGTAAAMRAAELQSEAGQPVSVLAIEKTARYGGTSALTTQTMAINPKQLEESINNGEDWVDLDELNAARDASFSGVAQKAELDPFWELYIEESGNVLDWQIAHGFEFFEPKSGFFGDGQLVVFDYGGKSGNNKTEIAAYFESMVEDYTELGGEYLLNTEGYELIYDEATDTVTGVKAKNLVDGTEYTINAKAVIMAAGGFGGNKDMVRSFNSNGAAYDLVGLTTNDGKLMQSAWDLGAATYGDEEGMNIHNAAPIVILNEFPIVSVEGTDSWTYRPATYSVNDIPLFLVTNKDCLFVDGTGARYANEALQWPWWQAGERYYSITSEQRLTELAENGFTHTNTGLFLNHGYNTFPLNTPVPEMFDVMEAGIEAGCVVKADTLAELAEALGMDPVTLEKTVADYNSFCETGVDTQFGKDAEYLKSIGSEGPFYAVIGEAYNYNSSGGLYIDEDFRVMHEGLEDVFDGLYAVGNDAPFIPSAFAGDNQAWCYISGYFGAEKAFEYVSAQAQ